MKSCDVVVIGGSLAGAACVRELERNGIDAIALERDHFPRRKVCGGFLSHGAVECIRRLGLLDDVRLAGAADVTSACVRINGVEKRILFEQPGLGISRNALDEIVARGARIEQGWDVREARRAADGFVVDGIRCSVVIDASGKLGRFTKRQTVDEFGIQYTESQPRGSVLDFWFFDDGYGGAVSVESGSNFCFLIKKPALRRYIDRSDCLVTGPLAYEKVPGDFIAIGDAAGMVDPFCGEGMRHALETGMLAARVVAFGIRRRASYAEMKWQYQSEWDRRWLLRRAAGAAMRRMRPHFGIALRFTPAWLLNRIWD
jgi:flavin-dependent dehydrogenase